MNQFAEALRAEAAQAAQELRHLGEFSRERLTNLLVETANVAARSAAGEDVSIELVALDASLKNLTREQAANVQIAARDIAFRVLAKVVFGRLGAK